MNNGFRIWKSRWFQILIGGIILFIAVEEWLKAGENPRLVIPVILVGAFTIPVAFVTYFYERERKLDREVHGNLPLNTLMVCFMVGGTLGVSAATILEFATLQSLNITSLFGVGLIEESAKLIFPLILFFQGKYRSESDGLLFGVASGMGFAGLETMGYGMTELINSHGSVNALISILLMRGVLSPAGHAAWTGLICALIWRGRDRERRALWNLGIVIGAYILAVVLHAFWNILNSFEGQTNTQMLLAMAGNMAIAFLSLFLLFRRVNETTRWRIHA